jgi:large subunit ribosomal protein L17
VRHRVSGRKLNRTASHREAMLRNLAASLFTHRRVETTLAKAKEARRFVESLITLAKRDDLHSRRLFARRIHDRSLIKVVFDEIAPLYKDRPGGYTRVVKLPSRSGDAAPMAILELVGFGLEEPGGKATSSASKKKEKKQKS